MATDLPLYPGAQPCIGSGYCCRQGVCPFGSWDQERHACKHLTEEDRCAVYAAITGRPVEDWAWSPAFGAGCSSPGNERRRAILARGDAPVPPGGRLEPAHGQ